MTNMQRSAAIVLGAAALAAPTAVLAQDDAYTLAEGAPVLGRSAIVRAVEGRVLVRSPGEERYRRLSRLNHVIPMGSFVDARRGKVRVTVMARRNSERTSTASFSEGKFQITQQTGSPYITDLRLAGGFGACERAAAAAKRKRKRVRGLWGDGKGRFRTSGRYSAATVRGTIWLVEDRCEGTLTRVRRGVVDVDDYSDSNEPMTVAPEGAPQDQAGAPEPVVAPQERSSRRVRVKRGSSYFARPDR
jgi:hypothetical protein